MATDALKQLVVDYAALGMGGAQSLERGATVRVKKLTGWY